MTCLVAKTLKHWRQSQFVWGQTDCILSTADYAILNGAHDPTEQFRGTYSDEAGAIAVMAAHGGAHGLLTMLGVPEIDPACIKHGDFVMVAGGQAIPDLELTGIINHGRFAARGERGVVEIDTRFIRVIHAWGLKIEQPEQDI